jgi:hypothetical protein
LKRTGFLISLFGVSTLVAALSAQGRLIDQHGFVPDEAIVSVPLPATERAYADIDGRRLKALISEVTAISLKSRDAGDKMWGRIAGTPAERMTNDWLEGKFRALGLENVHRQDFPLRPQWFPKSWTVAFSGGGKTITCTSLVPAPESPSTPAGGLDLEAVWVGTGTAADFVGRNVRGKAVFIHDIPTPGTISHSVVWTGAIRRAVDQGAATIFVVYGISDNWSVWQSLQGGEGAARIPGFYMGFQDGSAVRDLIGSAGPVRVKLALETEMRSGLTSANVYGTLPGKTDENVIVTAHQDGYFQAALDNASGLAGLVTLAEHFSKVSKSARRRAITFVGTAGHHAGSAGTKWMHDNKDTFLAKTAMALNLEHLSVVDTNNWGPVLRKSTGVSARRWWTYGSPRLIDIVTSAFKTFGVVVFADMDTNMSGDMGVMSRDLPTVQTIQSPEIKHTDADTVEWIPAAGIEALVRSYAKTLDEVNKLSRAELMPSVAATPTARR